MNKTYISIIVLVVVAVFLFFVIKSKKSEAPEPVDQNQIIDVVENTTGETGTELEGIVTTNGEVKEFTVSGKNFAFEPSTIKVKKGDKVKITFNNTEGFHDFVIDEFGAATKQAKAPDTEVIEFVADKTGSFEYYCSVGTHRTMGMKGTLIVE